MLNVMRDVVKGILAIVFSAGVAMWLGALFSLPVVFALSCIKYLGS